MRRNAVGRYLSLARSLYLKKIPLIPRIFYNLSKIIFSCDIPYQADIHETVKFGHNGLGVVVHPKTSIGQNTIIMQHVTLGGNVGKFRIHEGKQFSYPIIGKNVYIGPGAQLIGAVFIGDNAQIGAGAIVKEDVPKNGLAVGVPAKTIKILSDDEILKDGLVTNGNK